MAKSSQNGFKQILISVHLSIASQPIPETQIRRLYLNFLSHLYYLVVSNVFIMLQSIYFNFNVLFWPGSPFSTALNQT